MKRIIIGSAGHIDHGKTSMIRELTGFDGDSTPEEKKREITIELSFSSMKQDDKEISFIDVPGHEKLVKTMISGAFGFDYALLAIDANEGIKPQTLEHLLILDSIKPIELIVVLTKSDLAEQSWMKKLETEVEKKLQEYKNLSLKKILPFSIKNSEQIRVLKEYLFTLRGEKEDSSLLPRLYVDRSFALAGAGCVITGTMLGGSIKTKDSLFVPKLQKSVKVKSIQTHGQAVDEAKSGQRSAINLSDISHNELSKGMLITKKGLMRGFKEVGVVIYQKNSKLIKHQSELTCFFGTMSIQCKIMLLSEDDEKIIATLKFDEDMYLLYGEPFILRASNTTIGGGFVLNPIADPIKKQQKIELLDALLEKNFKRTFEILVSAHKKGFGLVCSLQRFNMEHAKAVEISKQTRDVILDEKSLVVYPQKAFDALTIELRKIYERNRFALLSPLSLSNKIPWASEFLAELAFEKLQNEGVLVRENGLYMTQKDGQIDVWQEITNGILEILNSQDFMPPAPYNIYDEMDLDRVSGDGILKKLCSSNSAIRLAHNHFIGSKALNNVLAKIREIIKAEGYADVSNVKERLGISRKYAINYLEYLDRFDDIAKADQRRIFKN